MLAMKYFDLHCDTPSIILSKGESLTENTGHVSLAYAEDFSIYAQFYAVWIPSGVFGEEAFNQFVKTYEYFIGQIEKNGNLKLCLSHEDLTSARKTHMHAAFISVENAAALGGKITNVKRLYDMGVRLMSITWNGNNELADGVGDDNAKGLTAFGSSVVKELNSCGMIVDVSHLPEAGFWDVCEVAEKSFVASHSNASAICGHRRNLNDRQITEIVNRSGLIGINIYPTFLNDGNSANIGDVIKHIDYICSLGGQDVIAIGADLDGVGDLPEGIENLSDMAKIREELLRKNYSEQLADNIMYNNAETFIGKML